MITQEKFDPEKALASIQNTGESPPDALERLAKRLMMSLQPPRGVLDDSRDPQKIGGQWIRDGKEQFGPYVNVGGALRGENGRIIATVVSDDTPDGSPFPYLLKDGWLYEINGIHPNRIFPADQYLPRGQNWISPGTEEIIIGPPIMSPSGKIAFSIMFKWLKKDRCGYGNIHGQRSFLVEELKIVSKTWSNKYGHPSPIRAYFYREDDTLVHLIRSRSGWSIEEGNTRTDCLVHT